MKHKSLSLPFMLGLLFIAFILLSTGCGDDDDDTAIGVDDDVAPVDDDETDDDATPDDDDQVDDDVVDDDVSDDDSGDDDTGDDDASPDPYADMTPSGPTIDETLAIASHMSTGPDYDWAREYEIQKEVEAGVSYVRRGFYWNSIEPNNDIFYFDGYDVLVDLIYNAGMKVTAMLHRAVGWAAPGGSPSEIPPEDWADFTGTVAERYADKIDYYEIWNEENSPAFWDPEQDPDHYGELLKAAFTAIHEKDDTAVVMMGGLSAFDPNLFDPRGVWNFIARVGEYHPDICDYMDAVAIHPYTFLQQPGPELSIDWGIYRYPDLRNTIADVRGLLADIGCEDKPIHLTEMGWPDYYIGWERQGAYYARGLLLARAAGVESYFWYTFYDENGPGKFDFPTEDFFGLYTYPDEENPEAKPSFYAMIGAHEMLGNAQYAGDLGAKLEWGDDNYALAFVDGQGNWTIGLWRGTAKLNEEAAVSVPFPANVGTTWTLYNQSGEEQTNGSTSSGAVDVTINGYMQYLRFTVE